MTTTLTIPTLDLGDLTLRAPQMSDYEAYAAFCASPRSAGVGGPYDRDAAFARLSALIGQWHLRGYGRWMVTDTETGTPLGVVGLYHPVSWPEPEIGWSVFDNAEGRGVAFRAARASRAYAYDVLGWSTVISCTMPDNPRSIALARRMGCTREQDFVHPTYGTLQVWRHQPAEALR